MEEKSSGMRYVKKKKARIDVDGLAEKLLAGDRSALAKAITLVESNALHHFEDAQALLQTVQPHAKDTIRIGISGVPGAGKSTFIERFGCELCELGHKVAVLAIDPSSTISGGSILGDKTRMEKLSAKAQAFIRPSPSEGTLGGVHRKTRESILLCEAAGFDVILVETVGVGQSEAIVRSMTDFFLLLVLTGAGDELQGMKKGIMELADAIVVNKADGDNIEKAEKTRAEYNQFMHYLQAATPSWTTRAYTCSSLTGEGIRAIWDVIGSFHDHGRENGFFADRRKSQAKEWLKDSILQQLSRAFYNDERIKRLMPELESEVLSGEIPVSKAVMKSMECFFGR
ncbi:MAG: methylmalonyl Co-A mutase-associated GTPase MeaB [Bacillus sp. (in: firmicutes)]